MFEELYQTVKARYGAGASNQSMSDWISNNTTIKRATPFSFDKYEFQRAIIDDMHPDLSVIKCSQVGLTEVQLRKYLAMLTRQDNLSGIFTLPNEDMFKRVYKTRLKPMMDRDEIFNPPTDTKPIRSTGLVQIRDSFGYITGCGEDDATSIPADFLFHDELDLSPEDMIGLYQSRLQNSDMKITQKFSTPTFKGFGIDKSYALTDQREYLARCGSCNHWQIPVFNRRFVHCEEADMLDVKDLTDITAEQIALMALDETYVKCEKCHARLDLANPEMREWVARHPGRTAFRGYYVRPFSAGRLNPAYVFGQLAKYRTQGFIRGFYNTVLGEPYNSADAQIQRDDVEACMKGGEIPNVGDDTPVFLGVDVGFQCHITLSYDDPVTFEPVWVLFETVPYARLETRIAELRMVYNVVQGAIDRFPFTPTADAIRQHTGGVIMPIQWRGVAGLAPVKDELGELTHYSANPTLIFDRMQAVIGQRKMVIRGYTHLKETLITHVCDMVRDEKPDANAEAVWKKTSGNDHFFHSMAFNMLSRRICEHMYHTQSGSEGSSSTIVGTVVGATTQGRPLLGSAARSSRLGRE
ncbi:phage terminase large subunit family protein [Sphingomonas jaspsi]|uniref:phage terminase large subunit family protein n=1 Tax=Sphingomonas jaspsi TaxID=392409 RepID=UPI0004ACD6B2|nr:phage terminase large subunit family protein [Sphingomonas jaspsi]